MNATPRRIPSYYLRRAKACREKLVARITPRTLHDFRTSLRRLEAVLRLEKKLLGKSRFRDEISQIKHLRDLTNPCREADVTDGILKAVRPRPIQAPASPPALPSGKEAKTLQTALGDKAFDLFFLNVEKSLRAINGAGRAKGVRKKMRKSFEGEMDLVRESLRDYRRRGPNPKILHRLRVRAKRLRYGLELFPFLRQAGKKKILKAAHRVHDVLGLVRDLQAAEKKAEGAEAEMISNLEREGLRAASGAIRRLENAVD